MKDYFEYQGNTSITGSRDATRESFQKGLIENGEEWMEMIKSRNQSSHTYNQDTATEINNKIKNSYYSLFQLFLIKMESLNQ
jgi:nucleotidyltransferase substrate binding protein (TIGR01987 family)